MSGVDRLGLIEHDAIEDAYQRGRLSGIADERERAAKAGVLRGGEYVMPANSLGAVDALRAIADGRLAFPAENPADFSTPASLARYALERLGGQ